MSIYRLSQLEYNNLSIAQKNNIVDGHIYINSYYKLDKIPYHIIDKLKTLKFINLQHVDELDNIYNKL